MSRLGVVLVALVVGTAAAQTRRPDADAGVPLVTRLPSHLGDPATVDELKLTPEQVSALTPKAGKAGAPPNPAKIKEVLTPEQHRRAVRLMAQDALRSGRGAVITPAALVAVPASAFRRYPELADAANLTRDQRRRVSRVSTEPTNPEFRGSEPAAYGGLPSAAHVILTAEQSAALASFVGPLRTTPFAAASDEPPAPPTFARPTRAEPTSVAQRVTTALNNRGELKLTPEQVTTLSTLQNSARLVARVTGAGEAPPQPPRPTPPPEAEAALAKALTAQQLARLGQIELWQQVPAGADETAKLDVPRVASAVALTPAQKAGLKAIGEAHRRQAEKAISAAESATALKAALAAARADVAAGVAKLLTPEQAARLRDLFGPEYRGPGMGGPGNDVLRRIRVAGYNRYQLELMAVNRLPGVAEDLRLSEEQKTALAAAEAEINRQFSQGFDFELPEDELAKQLAERSKAVEKALVRHLNADQRKRLPGIGIQLRRQLNADRGGGAAVYPPTGTPGVADALKLTPEQRKRIVETGQEDDVLSPAQRDELKQLAGPPLTGGFGFGGRARVMPPSVRVAILHAGTAHAELKLDAEQARVVAEVIEAHAAELRPPTAGRTGEFGGYVEPPQPALVEETLRACEKACASLLTPDQRARLDQLALQAAARESLTAALARPEVAGALALSSDQQAALSAVTADYHARVAEINALPSMPGWAELRSRALNEAREKARDRMTAVLTAHQRAAWRELTGPPNPAVTATAPPAGGRRDP